MALSWAHPCKSEQRLPGLTSAAPGHSGVTKRGNCLPCKIVRKSYIFRVFRKAYHVNQVTEEKVFDFLCVAVCKLCELSFPAVKEIKIVVVALRGVVNVVCCGFI